MAIRYLENSKTLILETAHTTYQMKISKYDYLLHTYYGEKLSDEDLSYLIQPKDRGFSPNPYEAEYDRTFSLDVFPQEFSSDGCGDFRKPSIEIKNGDGSTAFLGKVKKHHIRSGKYSLPGLPALFATDNDTVDTLEITLQDEATKVIVVLLYSVFEEKDIITRAVKVINQSDQTIYLNRIMSTTLDFMESDYDFIHFAGRHTMERNLIRTPLRYGVQSIESSRGASSHQHNPFVILCRPETDEDHGDCYGFSFVYSGNFRCEIEKDQFDQTRLLFGINPRGFSYQLKTGECFDAPETVLTYSNQGFAKLTHQYHDIYRNNLCRSHFSHLERPIVINSWEAAYFDFDDEKLLHIAKEAVDMGVEMFVLDDGWFGKRDSDFSGLGDWETNTSKIKRGLPDFAKEINKLGLKFGLWVEPEMVSEDSNLYRTHPEWCMKIKGRAPVRGRYQLVLDLSQKAVCDYLINTLNHILDSANIEYIKWDLNRNMTDVWSSVVDFEHQGEIYHRYMLGLYYIFDQVILTHPDILFCGCAGGGGRYDPAMLYYYPQVWCSDNTDAVNRMSIQYGTSFVYPINTLESHVSICPNHQTGRTTPFDTRGTVAMDGILGYELDSTKLTAEEKYLCREQIASYKKYYDLIAYGDYYRLTDPVKSKKYMAWQHVSKDQKTALVSIVITNKESNEPQKYVRIKGLLPNQFYSIKGQDGVYSGRALMKAGIPLPDLGEYESVQYYITAVS
ncbi:MAG: alpha-galactosidase [Lachnospiraceae bacterium]|nr:alpha-galactosidase [Lachnospiraceae bacterium]